MRKMIQYVAAPLAAVLLSAGSVSAQQFTMKIASVTVNDAIHDWMNGFKSTVEQRSNNRIKVEIYPASQLGSMQTTLDGVALGTLEMSCVVTGFVIPFDSRFQILDAPGLFESVEHSQKIFFDPDIRKRIASFGASRNMEPLWVFATGEMVVASHKPIRHVSDFKGMKVRVTGATPFYVDPFKNLGASPVALSLGDVLPALQNKTIDGAVGGINYFPFVKYYDVTKFATYLPNTWAVATGVVSRQFMQRLGPELERIVREEARKHEPVLFTRSANANKAGAELWVKNGGEVIRFDSAETGKYLQTVNAVVSSVVTTNAAAKQDYEALLAASKRLR